jgi:penicillin amidase
MRKFIKKTAFVLVFFLLGVVGFFILHFLISKPSYKGKAAVEGLSAEVEIFTDSWGVPHIYAQNEKDLFFACGYVHAKERMWQMDLFRRTGYGRLSELFGRAVLKRDMFMRIMGLKQAAEKDFAKLSPQMKDFLLAYSRGINVWLESRTWNWPPEFVLLRSRPEPWTPMDSLVIKGNMALLLCADFPSEIVRANLVERLGEEKALSILEEGVEVPDVGLERASLSGFMDMVFPQESNNWVLAGTRTSTGRPLLANDPHLEIQVPPIWYEMHLNCPAFNVIGVTIPGVPLVIIGHNEHIAWGITNSAADVQDLYIERFNESGDMFLTNEGWEPLRKKEEVFRIKGENVPETMEVFWTSRGPVISPLVVNGPNPISLRWTAHEGGRALESFYLLNKARDWQDFTEALSLFGCPSQNIVYADRSGNIGYYLNGKIPLRDRKAGLFPYPGWLESGDWRGYIPEEEKPFVYNPDDGLIVTANQRIITEDYPHYISVDWDAPFRANRIKELLVQGSGHTVESLRTIQNDVYSKKGELILPLFQQISGAKDDVKKALNIIRNWNLETDSGAAPALYEAFMNFFPAEIFQDELAEDFRSFDLLFRRKEAGVLNILSDSSSPWFDNRNTEEIEDRKAIVKKTLSKAYRWLRKRFGSPGSWDWGEMNAVRFRHTLGRMILFRFFNLGSQPQGGDAFTVGVNYRTKKKSSWSASYRQIIDLSDWEKSASVITSGQSGHFMSRFYDNQLHLWLEGRYHPMVFSLENVKAQALAVLVLKPVEKKS